MAQLAHICTPVLGIFLLCPDPALASPADDAFEAIASRYVDDLPNFSPVAATLIGDHSADHELDQVDTKAWAFRRQRYLDYQTALSAVDRDSLSQANQIDAALLQNDIESRLFELDTFEEWAWNPLVYVSLSGSSIFGLVARDYAPLEERLAAATSRLEQFPRFLEQARESLQPERVPKIHAETAVQQNAGIRSIIDMIIVSDMDELPQAGRNELSAAIESARKAIDAHEIWLKEELLPHAAGDFRIGADLYDTKLALVLNSSLSRQDIKARAENEYETVRKQMYEVAKEVYAATHPYTTFPDSPDEAYKQVVIRAALEQAYQQMPPRDGIVDVATEYLQQATDFIIENDIVTMPDDPVQIIVKPEFTRGVTFAYLDSPGPLDKGQPAFYAVAPLPSDWTDEQVRSFLREYNLLSIQNLTLHEGAPGHYVQLALSNRYPSTLRAVLASSPFMEGWAVYAERMMIDAGYLDYDPLMRLINLK